MGFLFLRNSRPRLRSSTVAMATAADEEGRRRLDNPEDFVRVEVGTALKRGVRVIPVLVEGAPMPPASQLPQELKPLARRNALSVSHEGLRADSERLVDSETVKEPNEGDLVGKAKPVMRAPALAKLHEIFLGQGWRHV
jgi:hypothetical protein